MHLHGNICSFVINYKLYVPNQYLIYVSVVPYDIQTSDVHETVLFPEQFAIGNTPERTQF